MLSDPAGRTTFRPAEAAEIRSLLDAMPTARRSVRRMSTARLRRIGLPPSAGTGRAEFDALVSSRALTIDQDGTTVRAVITPHPSGNIFRVAVGVTGDPVDERWSAFGERYHWFGQKPQSVTSGAHLFVLAVDRWRSAVVGLYETVSAGADKLPDSPDPDRWPWALGVRPLAAIPPPQAERVEGQQGPQSGLPERIYDEAALPQLYAAVVDSPLPPGPQTQEQRVQELEPEDVVDDVLDAVTSLGKEARRPAILDRAIEIGGWSEDELAARAWYTGGGTTSHVRHIIGKALDYELRIKRLVRHHGSSPYVLIKSKDVQFGVAYRRAGDRESAAVDDHTHPVDIAALEKATRRHMQLQDLLAETLLRRGIEPRSPGSWEPQFDLVFEHAGVAYIVEAKTGNPVVFQQVRIGVGQVLEYCHRARGTTAADVRPVLILEAEPPDPWRDLSENLGIAILRADDLQRSLAVLLDTK
jgi:hypothetical protein